MTKIIYFHISIQDNAPPIESLKAFVFCLCLAVNIGIANKNFKLEINYVRQLFVRHIFNKIIVPSFHNNH